VDLERTSLVSRGDDPKPRGRVDLKGQPGGGDAASRCTAAKRDFHAGAKLHPEERLDEITERLDSSCARLGRRIAVRRQEHDISAASLSHQPRSLNAVHAPRNGDIGQQDIRLTRARDGYGFACGWNYPEQLVTGLVKARLDLESHYGFIFQDQNPPVHGLSLAVGQRARKNDCMPETAEPIDAGVRIGHVHLKVADLERALAFYRGVLGFELTLRYGDSAAFLSAGGYHHHLALNTWESKDGAPPPRGSTGLYHLAILYPTRRALAEAFRRLQDAGVPLDGAADHGVSEALYLHDPDHNGVELYRDRPREEWPRTPAGGLDMYTRRLDLQDLLRELD
jgi:catechol 2,3-dioxygenase